MFFYYVCSFHYATLRGVWGNWRLKPEISGCRHVPLRFRNMVGNGDEGRGWVRASVCRLFDCLFGVIGKAERGFDPEVSGYTYNNVYIIK